VSTFLVATVVVVVVVSYRSVVPSRRRFASGVVSSIRASVSSRSSVLSRSSAVSVVMPVGSVRLLRASLSCDEKMVNDDTIKTGQSLSVSFAFFVGREKKRDDVSLFYKFNFSLSFSNPL